MQLQSSRSGIRVLLKASVLSYKNNIVPPDQPTSPGSTDIPSMYEGKKALAGKYRTDQAHTKEWELSGLSAAMKAQQQRE